MNEKLRQILILIGISLTITVILLLFIKYPSEIVPQILLGTLVISCILAPLFLLSYLKRTASLCISIGSLSGVFPQIVIQDLETKFGSVKGVLIDNHYAISIAAFTLAGLCLILDVFFFPKKEKTRKEKRKELRERITTLLNENKNIFDLYGPSSNQSDNPFTDAHKMWNSSVKDTLIPNNAKIVKLLGKNISLLNNQEKDTYHKFKLHHQGFKKNKLSKSKNNSVPLFPKEILNILK